MTRLVALLALLLFCADVACCVTSCVTRRDGSNTITEYFFLGDRVDFEKLRSVCQDMENYLNGFRVDDQGVSLSLVRCPVGYSPRALTYRAATINQGDLYIAVSFSGRLTSRKSDKFRVVQGSAPRAHDSDRISCSKLYFPIGNCKWVEVAIDSLSEEDSASTDSDEEDFLTENINTKDNSRICLNLDVLDPYVRFFLCVTDEELSAQCIKN